MASDRDDSHDQLLDELRQHLARTDAPPTRVVDAARAAIEVRDLDAQLAELLRDSALEDKELAGVRGQGQRMLTFGRGASFVEVDISSEGDRRTVAGYVVPADEGALHVEHPAGAVQADIDDRGRFRCPGVPAGLVRFRIEIAGQLPLITPWLPI